LAGAAYGVTVNALDFVPTPPLRFVTVTLRDPRVADGDTEILTRRWVEFKRVTETTVMPVPEKTTLEADHDPLRKFDPVKMMFWLTAPRGRELGLSDEIVGLAVTLNAPNRVARPRSMLRTVTLRSVFAAVEAIEMLTVRCVAFVRVTELTVIPLPENQTELLVHVPAWKFEPVMTMF
jgi:hypothetical protein